MLLYNFHSGIRNSCFVPRNDRLLIARILIEKSSHFKNAGVIPLGILIRPPSK